MHVLVLDDQSTISKRPSFARSRVQIESFASRFQGDRFRVLLPRLVLRRLGRLELAKALGFVQQVGADDELSAVGADGGAFVQE